MMEMEYDDQFSPLHTTPFSDSGIGKSLEKENIALLEPTFVKASGNPLPALGEAAKAKARELSQSVAQSIETDSEWNVLASQVPEEDLTVPTPFKRPSGVAVTPNSLGRKRVRINSPKTEQSTDLFKTPIMKRRLSRGGRYGSFKAPRASEAASDPGPSSSGNHVTFRLPDSSPALEALASDFRSLSALTRATEALMINSPGLDLTAAEMQDIVELSNLELEEDDFGGDDFAFLDAPKKHGSARSSLSEAEQKEVEECSKLCFDEFLDDF